KIVLSNNAIVVFNGTNGSPASITLTGGTNALDIPAGTTFELAGAGGANGTIAIIVDAASTGTIGGDVIFRPGAVASTAHRIEGRAASQIVFLSGATSAMAAATTGAGGGFGGATQGFSNSVVFQ